ncbi:uncharacterized protein TNCV_1767981 [Trichonephila clavipes]|nr:uncharacterized protein TNCV_1767981 [Trichonephila clavipes]
MTKTFWSLFKAKRNINDADFDDENEMNNAVAVPMSSEMGSIMKDGAPFLFPPINKSASEIKEIISDVRFPKQKNQRVIFQCGDRAWLASEHVVLFTATLTPQIRPKIG